MEKLLEKNDRMDELLFAVAKQSNDAVDYAAIFAAAKKKAAQRSLGAISIKVASAAAAVVMLVVGGVWLFSKDKYAKDAVNDSAPQAPMLMVPAAFVTEDNLEKSDDFADTRTDAAVPIEPASTGAVPNYAAEEGGNTNSVSESRKSTPFDAGLYSNSEYIYWDEQDMVLPMPEFVFYYEKNETVFSLYGENIASEDMEGYAKAICEAFADTVDMQSYDNGFSDIPIADGVTLNMGMDAGGLFIMTLGVE